jgi:uncharacterized damage-inducible protein DinB
MPIIDALLPEFDQEMANTRKSLERVPDDKLDWKPHEKSPSMRWLATHLAVLPSWAVVTIERDSIDLGKPGGAPAPIQPAAAREEALKLFDRNVAEARAAIAGATDELLAKPWSLLMNEKAILTMPKAAVLRAFVMSHTIHHRAQLGVYLRLNDIPVPAIYGPSADEGQLG